MVKYILEQLIQHQSFLICKILTL